jgi:hypothetical protein
MAMLPSPVCAVIDDPAPVAIGTVTCALPSPVDVWTSYGPLPAGTVSTMLPSPVRVTTSVGVFAHAMSMLPSPVSACTEEDRT